MRSPDRLLVLIAAATLAGCAAEAPPGVSRDRLDDEVARVIGDPTTCVLIAEADSGRRLYRYNSGAVCAQRLPACDAPGERDANALLKAVLADRQARTLSCDTAPDGSRGVGWAAGSIEGSPYVYAAVMEGPRAFPGRIMAERLASAFRRAGVTSPAQSSR